MKQRLLFEGPDDEHVVKNLLFNHGMENVFDLKSKDGVVKLFDSLPDELEATDISCLGVIIDADTEMPSRWARIENALRRAGYSEIPRAPERHGTVITAEGLVPVGIWLMPDNIALGALEDFVGRLIDNGDNLWPKAQTDVDAIPVDHRKFSAAHRSKAVIHTWLAWQEEPGTRLGQVFRKRYLDPLHPNAEGFVSWLKRLIAATDENARVT
jgi:hypothetical protein